MIQALPLKIILLIAVVATLTVVALADVAIGYDSLPSLFRYCVFAVDVVFVLLAIKPIWRTVWRWVPFVESKTFPDINGQYDVEIEHNWPIQEKLFTAAREGGGFDIFSISQQKPPMQKANMKASIDMGMFSVRIRLSAADSDAPQNVIRTSRTIACSLIKPCDGYNNRISYIFHQHNRREKVATSDDSSFFGAAVLEIDAHNPGLMQGEYWTNRAWEKGINTAGVITFRKTSR